MGLLHNKVIAVVFTDGVDDTELREVLKALRQAGAQCDLISPHKGEIRTWKNHRWSGSISVDKDFTEACSDPYDALFIPGGTLNCDSLRSDDAAVNFVSDFFEEGKPVAAICHGPQLLIEAEVVEGRKVTSHRSIRTDLENAQAFWIDQEVVVDEGLVTSRSPRDLPVFIAKMLEEFSEGFHQSKHL